MNQLGLFDLQPSQRERVEDLHGVYVAVPDGDSGYTTHGPLPVFAGSALEAYAVCDALGMNVERCLALPAREGDWSDELMAMLEDANRRAEDDLQHLRSIHARILGCSLDELDAKLAQQKAEEEKVKQEARAARPPRASSRARQNGTDAACLPTERLDDRQRELLALVRVDGNVGVYTREERIPDWDALKRVMLALGARWKTRKGFVFPDDVDGREAVRLALETGEVLDPKAAGFFPTPDALADRVVALAELRPGDLVLEPSAGRGALARAALRACPSARIRCCELLPENRKALERDGFALVGEDFLKLDPKALSGGDPEALGWNDAVVMNPPFAGQADIDHVEHALNFLNPTGSLVSIMSAGVVYRDDKKTRRFHDLVEGFGGRFEPNPDGSFIESGTGVRTVTLVIPRRAA